MAKINFIEKTFVYGTIALSGFVTNIISKIIFFHNIKPQLERIDLANIGKYDTYIPNLVPILLFSLLFTKEIKMQEKMNIKKVLVITSFILGSVLPDIIVLTNSR